MGRGDGDRRRGRRELGRGGGGRRRRKEEEEEEERKDKIGFRTEEEPGDGERKTDVERRDKRRGGKTIGWGGEVS